MASSPSDSNSSSAFTTKDIVALDQKLRRHGAAAALKLPTVAFIGKRSAGKSSVIRSLTGVRLPRAPDIITRRDLCGCFCAQYQQYDLPGLTSSGDPQIAKRLDELAISYIKETQVLILVVLAMN
ncbi:hypothetical protein FRC02_002055, partial [Tulasnella sp. 418]